MSKIPGCGEALCSMVVSPHFISDPDEDQDNTGWEDDDSCQHCGYVGEGKVCSSCFDGYSQLGVGATFL